MLLSRYLIRPVYLSLAANSAKSLGQHQSSCWSSNTQKPSQTSPSIPETTNQQSPNQNLPKHPILKGIENKSGLVLQIIHKLLKSNTFKLSSLMIGGLVSILLFSFQFLGYNYVSTYILKKVKQRKENIQFSKIKKIEEIIKLQQKKLQQYEIENYQIQKELSVFQASYSCYDQLKHLLQSNDYKPLVYIQTFIGSSVGTNLKRIAWELSERKNLQEKENNQQPFKKLYYVNLKEPATYAISNDEDSDWGIAKDLNYLLTSIIGTTYSKLSNKKFSQRFEDLLMTQQYLEKKNRPKKSILIIEEAQLLQSFLNDKDKKAKLEELYQKIYYVQRKKDVRVFFIGNNNSFFHRFYRQLKNPNLQDFKYQLIQRMSEQDIRNIIRYRSKIDLFYKQQTNLKNKFERYFNKMLDYIVDTNDNIREILGIMKEGKMDLKEIIHQKTLQEKLDSKFSKKNQKEAMYQWKIRCLNVINQQLRKIYFRSNADKQKGHYQAIKDIKYNIVKVSEEFIDQKKRSIINQIDRAYHQNYTGPQVISKEDIIKSKLTILLLIFSKKFDNKGQDNSFVYNMTKNQAAAYEQLNKAEIIHGLKFSSKAYERAFYYILEEQHADSTKFGQISYGAYEQNFISHRNRINKYSHEMEEMQKNFEKQFESS